MKRNTVYTVHSCYFEGRDLREAWLMALFYKSVMKFGLSPGVPGKFSIERVSGGTSYRMVHSYWDEPANAQ